jgi:hypothetical protein
VARMHPTIRQTLDLDRSGDPWAEAHEHWFAVTAVLNLRGEAIPADWQYRPSPLQTEDAERRESWAAGEYFDAYDAGELTGADMRAAGNVLARYVDLLRAAGRDY